jgi:hypothetical protein
MSLLLSVLIHEYLCPYTWLLHKVELPVIPSGINMLKSCLFYKKKLLSCKLCIYYKLTCERYNTQYTKFLITRLNRENSHTHTHTQIHAHKYYYHPSISPKAVNAKHIHYSCTFVSRHSQIQIQNTSFKTRRLLSWCYTTCNMYCIQYCTKSHPIRLSTYNWLALGIFKMDLICR